VFDSQIIIPHGIALALSCLLTQTHSQSTATPRHIEVLWEEGDDQVFSSELDGQMHVLAAEGTNVEEEID